VCVGKNLKSLLREGIDKITGRHNKGLNLMTPKTPFQSHPFNLMGKAHALKYVVGFDA